MGSSQNECSKIILKDQDGNHIVSVDYFKNKNNAKYQFLTHAHKIDAISETWIKPIYCSKETAKILPVLTSGSSGTGVRSRFLRLLETGRPTVLEKGLQVTLFDSNHCYGASMFLFEGSKLETSPVLCTGHFKADEHFFARFHNSPMYSLLKRTRIHTVYFDNRMISDDNFLTKDEVISGIVSLAASHPLAVILIPCHRLGKEDILESISTTLNESVELYDSRYAIYQSRCGYESVPGNFVEQSFNSVRLKAIPRSGIIFKDYIKDNKITNYILCDISHTELYESVTPPPNYRRFRYTEHSKRSEIFEFLKNLRFDNLVPVSGPLKPEDRSAIVSMAENYMLNYQSFDERTLFAPPILQPDLPVHTVPQPPGHIVPQPPVPLERDCKPLTSSQAGTSTADVIENGSDHIPTVSNTESHNNAVPDPNPITNDSKSTCTASNVYKSASLVDNPSDQALQSNHEAGPSALQNVNTGAEPIVDYYHMNNYFPVPSNSSGRAEEETFYNNEYYGSESYTEPSTQRPVIILSRDPTLPPEQYYEPPKFYDAHAENGQHRDYVPIHLEGEEIFITEDDIAEFFVPVSENINHEHVLITEYVAESTSGLQQEADHFPAPVVSQQPKFKKKRVPVKRDDDSVGAAVKNSTKLLRILEKIDREKNGEKKGELVLKRLSENFTSQSIFKKNSDSCIHEIPSEGICVDCILPAFDESVLSPRKRIMLQAKAPLECGVRKKRFYSNNN